MPKKPLIAIAGDVHFPYHDKAAVRAFLKYLSSRPFTEVIIHGDLVDFEAFSRFLKDPRSISNPQRELDMAHDFLLEIEKRTPKAKHVFGYGNHEERLDKLLMKNAPSLLQLDCLDLKELLGIQKGWHIIQPNHFYKVEDLVVYHGIHYATTTTNRRNISKFGGLSVVQGHSHRLSQNFVRSFHGIHSACEAGCLCDLDPPYCSQPDWQHGFATFENGQLHLHNIQGGKVC